MKRFAALLLVMCLAVIAHGQHKGPVKYRPVKTILVDLNHDRKLDTIMLSWSVGNRGEFNRISISLAGFGKKTFTAKQDWAAVDSIFLRENKNIVHTNLIFVGATPLHTVILLFGVESGAGYRDEFSIINIENNQVKMVFDHDDEAIDVEAPVFLKDLNADNHLEFAYQNLTECVGLNADTCGYNPFIIYTVADTCRKNKPLMKAYNEKHYIFAGYDTDERIMIYDPGNGKKLRVVKRPQCYKGTR